MCKQVIVFLVRPEFPIYYMILEIVAFFFSFFFTQELLKKTNKEAFVAPVEAN